MIGRNFLKIYLIIILVLSKEINSLWLFSNSEEKARKYLKLSLEEYKKAIKENPNNYKLIDEYIKLLTVKLGETEAKIELALLFQEINLNLKVSEILLEISLKDRENALSYIEKRINDSKDIKEKINLYNLAVSLSPQNGKYWFHLGKLLLGINKEKEGIEALEKAYETNFKEISLFYYLAIYYFQRGDYKKSKSYILEGLTLNDDISLHKILFKIYYLEGNKELMEKEKEKIQSLIAMKTKEKEKKPPSIEKPIIMKKKIEGINEFYFLGVSKKDQKLYLVKFDGFSYKVEKEFKCTTGKNQGNKEKKGDKRTPEGTYLLVSKIEPPALPPKYGISAYPLNYPNPIDKRLKKDGNGIWLHATPIERPPYNSEGCVVINDNDMKEVSKYIIPGKTLINISKDSSFLNFPYIEEIKNTIENWRKGWESMKIEEYIKFYDDNFMTDGKNKNQWKTYKEKINKSKKFIKVDISDLQILPYGETELGFLSVSFFKQNYLSNNFKSEVRKILYLVKRENNWKIICEETL